VPKPATPSEHGNREPLSIFSAATVLVEATDKTSRKKTFELAALSGNVIWFIAAEPETTN